MTTSPMRRIAVVGWEEGSAGLVHSWASEAGLEVVCFVHPQAEPPQVSREAAMLGREATQFAIPENGRFKDLPLISAADWPQEVRRLGVTHILVALSDNARRLAEMARARQAGLALASAIHPSVTVLADLILGDNVILHARAIIGYRAELRDGVIVNTGAQVDHHCVLGAGCSLDPGVVLAGNVSIGSEARVHTGAVIRNKITVGVRAVIAAGAVVTEDVQDDVTVMGVPAKPRSAPTNK